MRRWRAWHVAGVVLLLAVGGLCLYAFWPALAGGPPGAVRVPGAEGAAMAAEVEAVVVAPTRFVLRAEATGHLAPWRAATVGAEAGGTVVARNVEEGRAVAAGALLLQLDSRDARIALEEAEADLLEKRVAYALYVGSDRSAAPDSSRVQAARTALREAEEAFAQGRLTEMEVRDARRRVEAAAVLAGRDRGSVQAATTGLAQAEQQVERARLALSRTRAVAPFAGRIADVQVEVGQQVSTGQPLLSLLDDGRMKVDVNVLEADLARLRPGVTAQVRVPALDNLALGGTVHTINPSIDPETGTGRVTVVISNPAGRLVSGMFAYVALETGHLEQRLTVPAAAVLVRQGRDLVFVLGGGRARWTYVTVGARSGDEVEITDGIAPGDTVAVGGHVTLAHDAPVVVHLVETP